MKSARLWLGIMGMLVATVHLAALSQLKIICDKDGESIYVDGKFKTECDKDEVVRLIVHAGSHRLLIKKVDKGAKYQFVKPFKIGDGVQKVIVSDAKPVYNEYHYYKEAQKEESLKACDEYLEKYPKGRYKKAVKEIKAYLQAKKDFQLYKKYLHLYPKGRYVQTLKNYYFEHPLIQTLSTHAKAVLSLAVSKDGSKLFSGDTDNIITEWDLRNYKTTRKVKGPSWIKDLALSPSEKYLAFGGDVGVLNLQNWRYKIIKKNISGDIGFIDNEKLLAADGRRVVGWNIETGKQFLSLVEDKKYGVGLDHLALSPDKKYLFYGMYDEKHDRTVIKEYDLHNHKFIQTFFAPELHYSVLSLAVTPDSRYLISGTRNDAWVDEDGYVRKTLIVWDIETAKPYRIFAQKGNIYAIAVGPKGRIFAYGTSRGEIFVREIESGRLLKTIEAYSGVNDLVFTRDGKKIVGALDDGRIKVWYSGFFSKKNMLSLYFNRCQKGDIKACNDYLMGGGEKVRTVKNAILRRFKSVLKSVGGEIQYSFPKVYVQDRIGKYKYYYSNKNNALYRVESIVSDKGKTYVLIDVDYKNSGFTFNNPIYLIQNGHRWQLSQKFPNVYQIKPGTKRMKLIFVFDGADLKRGDYAIQESEKVCDGCMNIRNGHITEIR